MKLKNILLAALFLHLPSVSFAGSQTGTIDTMQVRASDGLVYFTMKGAAKTGSPACQGNQYWMIKDENSATGKRQYALLMAAQLAGKTITVIGFNTCIRWSDGEDVDRITLSS